MANYVSEITQFITRLKAERPHLEADQQAGRRIWWDQEPITPDHARRDAAARVEQKAYPYQTGPAVHPRRFPQGSDATPTGKPAAEPGPGA